MIVADIETTGLIPEKNGIISIGSVDFFNPERLFYQECKIDKDDKINEEALRINGFTIKEITERKKKTQLELIKEFIEWGKSCSSLIIAGENPSFDSGFIRAKAKKYQIEFPFGYRTYDLHTLSQTRHYEIYGSFKINEGRSSMNLDETLKFCGLLNVRNKNHRALEDAKLEAECFSRILYGKKLFTEYIQFKIPEVLIK